MSMDLGFALVYGALGVPLIRVKVAPRSGDTLEASTLPKEIHMRAMLPITIALTALSIASSAWSQPSNTASGKPDTPNQPMSHDCKAMMAQGEQAGAKGMAMDKDMPCGAQPAASAAKAKKTLKHDHTKFHKNQG